MHHFAQGYFFLGESYVKDLCAVNVAFGRTTYVLLLILRVVNVVRHVTLIGLLGCSCLVRWLIQTVLTFIRFILKD